jgi:hypothetical protein
MYIFRSYRKIVNTLVTNQALINLNSYGVRLCNYANCLRQSGTVRAFSFLESPGSVLTHHVQAGRPRTLAPNNLFGIFHLLEHLGGRFEFVRAETITFVVQWLTLLIVGM